MTNGKRYCIYTHYSVMMERLRVPAGYLVRNTCWVLFTWFRHSAYLNRAQQLSCFCSGTSPSMEPVKTNHNDAIVIQSVWFHTGGKLYAFSCRNPYSVAMQVNSRTALWTQSRHCLSAGGSADSEVCLHETRQKRSLKVFLSRTAYGDVYLGHLISEVDWFSVAGFHKREFSKASPKGCGGFRGAEIVLIERRHVRAATKIWRLTPGGHPVTRTATTTPCIFWRGLCGFFFFFCLVEEVDLKWSRQNYAKRHGSSSPWRESHKTSKDEIVAYLLGLPAKHCMWWKH